jgi:hypothetical protein
VNAEEAPGPSDSDEEGDAAAGSAPADPPPAAPNPAPRSGFTFAQVVALYEAAGLPVCDDEACIRERLSRLRAAPDGSDVPPSPLLEHREELLEVTFSFYAALADAAVSAAVAAGRRQMDAALASRLRELAREGCRADEGLTEKLAARYCAARELDVGAPLLRPALVEELTARADEDAIELRWLLPLDGCDEVEVRRAGVPSGREPEVRVEETLFRGRAAAFADRGAPPGRHTYRVFSRFRGQLSREAREVRAVRVGEVAEARASWTPEGVRLRWRSPASGTTIRIFRDEERPPLVWAGRHGPEAVDTTRQVHRGEDESFLDTEVREGVRYVYRLVADLGEGHSSRGAEVEVTVPVAPPAPAYLAASYKREGARDVVKLSWPAVEVEQAEYVVVRREGQVAPRSSADGTVVRVTRGLEHIDDDVAPGARYSYAVFARSARREGHVPATLASVDVVPDVRELRLRPGDGRVELTWKTPEAIRRVVVRRDLEPLDDPLHGHEVKLLAPGRALDEGLTNDRTHHYLVCCVYAPDGAGDVFSPGVRASAMPVPRPEPAAEFTGRLESGSVVCTWRPPPRGEVVVLRCAERRELPRGLSLAAEELDRLGRRIRQVSDGAAVDEAPDLRVPHYVAFTVDGAEAVCGGWTTVAAFPDVTDLTLRPSRAGVVLRWAWPEDCTRVRITRRAGRWPDGPEDPQAASRVCTRTDYINAGEKLVDPLGAQQGEFHYVVYAVPPGSGELLYSPGSGAGCRAFIHWAPWMTLRYRLERGPRPGALTLRWRVDDAYPRFAGFALVAHQTDVPASLEEGVELLRWKPEPRQVGGAHEAVVDLVAVRERRWPRFYCKVLLLDPEERLTTLVVHPNTSLPVLDSGEPERAAPRGAPRRASGTSVICPSCLAQFPASELRFATEAGEVLPARRGVLSRLTGAAPRAPLDARGRPLQRKLCPAGHVLPFTAGLQESLLIGLIGARFSGKSHYIASLVNRLQGQAGSDFRASLLPLTPETDERYRHDFYDPLFGKGVELPATVGAPPPLIYDLRLDARLTAGAGPRGVTLALYDTAGENLVSQDAVEQMLRYLELAAGLIVLVDPLQVPALREALPGAARLPEPDPLAEPSAILGRVLQLLEKGRALSESGPVSTPVAVVLTKCDVLRDAGLIDPSRLWNMESRHIGRFSDDEHEDMSGMMAECLRRWSLPTFLTVSLRFARHAFFGASATGCSSNQATRRYRFISPWRVEDPLLWLLAELGVIPARSLWET